jgi:hypothetical protein
MSTYCECGHSYGEHVASYFHSDDCECEECEGLTEETTGVCLAEDGCQCMDFDEDHTVGEDW